MKQQELWTLEERSRWWKKDERIALLKKEVHKKKEVRKATVIALLDLTSQHPMEWITLEEVYVEAGRSHNQARADLSQFSRLVKSTFPDNTGAYWPTECRGNPLLEYRMSFEIAELWKNA